ncbi:unnamed protein product [Microthlaspi erraticum]|uniref:Uncharacterized protein n=1 Tax=Microthlaspi erraticum TaxID=1685480 RepID=A0A6D2LKH6_9BRAS|nr:unnamed protein product [Microthlaspi erraticum]
MEDLPLKKRRRVQDLQVLQDPEPAGHNDENAVVLDGGADDDAVVQDGGDENAVVLDGGDNVVDLEDAEVNAAEVQNLAVDPLIPCKLRSVRRYLQTCALLGCQLRISPNSAHCCPGHADLAALFSQMISSFHCFDRFVDRNTTCAICLLNICRGAATGVPDLEAVENVFTTLPWNLPIIPENSQEWLFIKSPPARYQTMKDAAGVSTGIKWKIDPRQSLHIEELEHPPIFLTYFRLLGVDDDDDEWRLRLYQCQGRSLYCLTRGQEAAAPEPKVKTNRSNKNPPKDSNTPSSSSGIVGKKSGKNICSSIATSSSIVVKKSGKNICTSIATGHLGGQGFVVGNRVIDYFSKLTKKKHQKDIGKDNKALGQDTKQKHQKDSGKDKKALGKLGRKTLESLLKEEEGIERRFGGNV